MSIDQRPDSGEDELLPSHRVEQRHVGRQDMVGAGLRVHHGHSVGKRGKHLANAVLGPIVVVHERDGDGTCAAISRRRHVAAGVKR